MTETPLYLTVGGETVFATRHRPDRRTGRQAVLIVPPLGWDAMVTHHARREWALHLCAEGHDVLRFDLPGTGDSAGAFADDGSWETWQTVTEQLARWLREDSGAERVGAIGIAFGGYLAHEAAVRGAVDDLVEWGTPARGKRYVRELSAFAVLEEGRTDTPGKTSEHELRQGIEVGGYLVPARMVEALSVLDLAARSLPRDVRVLVLRRDGIGADKTLLEALEAAGNAVEVDPGRGFGIMVAEADRSRAPRETFAVVDRWLADAPRAAVAAVPLRTTVVESTTLVLDDSVEEPIAVTRPAGFLRGIVTRPRASSAADAPFTLVFLNAGAVPRTGPNRLWVRLARSAARVGIPSVRLDLNGIGDADGDAERFHDVSEFYVDWLVDETKTALQALRQNDLPSRQVPVGLCAGGFWGFHALLDDADVTSAVLINPRILFWHENIDALRNLRQTRRAVRSVTWQRVLRGGVSPRRWTAFVYKVTISFVRSLRPGTSASASVLRWHAAETESALDRLASAGKTVHLMFCASEPLRDELEDNGILGDGARHANVSFTPIQSTVHTVTPLHAQAQVERAFAAAVAAEASRTPMDASSVGDRP